MIENKTKNKIIKFRDDRDWLKYHNGKDLAIFISIEANELLENFQQSADYLDRTNKIESLEDELVDILIYSVMFADYYINIDEIIDNKLKKNLTKYPSDKIIKLEEKQ